MKIEPTYSKKSASKQADPSTLWQEYTLEKTIDNLGANSSGLQMPEDLIEIGEDLDTEVDALVDYKFVKSYRKKILESNSKPEKQSVSKSD